MTTDPHTATSDGRPHTAADLMSSPVIVAEPDMTVHEANEIFQQHDINHLPVVDPSGALVGMLSSSDLARLSHWRVFFQPTGPERNRMLAVMESLLVREVMNTSVATAHEGDTLAALAAVINQRHFHCLPIVDADGAVVGIVTAHDLLRAAYADVD